MAIGIYGARGAFNRVTRIKHKVHGITFLRNIARWKVTKTKNKNHMYTAHNVINCIDILLEYVNIGSVASAVVRDHALAVIINNNYYYYYCNYIMPR